jgi:hypothetical protein
MSKEMTPERKEVSTGDQVNSPEERSKGKEKLNNQPDIRMRAVVDQSTLIDKQRLPSSLSPGW